MDNDKKLEDIINFWQKPGFVYPESKPEIPVADQYQDYKQVQDIFEPRTQMYIEKEMGFDEGGLATPKRGLVDEPGSYAGRFKEDWGPKKRIKQGIPGYRVSLRRKTADGMKVIDQFFPTTKYKNLTEAKKAADKAYETFNKKYPIDTSLHNTYNPTGKSKYKVKELNKAVKWYTDGKYKTWDELTKVASKVKQLDMTSAPKDKAKQAYHTGIGIRNNLKNNKGKFVIPDPTGGQFKPIYFTEYSDKDFIKDLKAKKSPYEIATDYYLKNKKMIQKQMVGNVEYTRPIAYLAKVLTQRRKRDMDVAEELINFQEWSRKQKGPKTQREYSARVAKLLPLAIENGIVPKGIDTPSQYFKWTKKQKVDPLLKLFNHMEKIGVEHIAGVSRAVDIMDYKSLGEIVPLLGGKDVNFEKGLLYDRPMTGLAKNILKSDNATIQKRNLKALNNMSKEAAAMYNTIAVKYRLSPTDKNPVGGQMLERVTKGNPLSNTLLRDADLLMKQYVAGGGQKRKSFKFLDPDVQKTIQMYQTGDIKKGKKNLSDLLTDLCPNKASGGRVGMKLAGSVGVKCGADRFKQVFKNPNKGTQAERQLVGQIVKRGGTTAGRKLLYTLGPAGIGIDAMIEGALWGDDVLKGSSGEQAWKDNWLSYLDPSAYTGGLKVSGDRYNERKIAEKYKGDTAKFFNLTHAIEDKYRLENKLLMNEDTDVEKLGITLTPAQRNRLKEVNTIIKNHGGEEQVFSLIKEDSPLFNAAEMSSERFEEVGPGKQWDVSWLSGTREPGTPGQIRRDQERKREMEAYPTYDMFTTPSAYRAMDLEQQREAKNVIPELNLTERADSRDMYRIMKQPGMPEPSLKDYFYEDTGLSMLDEENLAKKWRYLIDTKGMRGTQDTRYAGGGIAGIRRPHSIPPESGPAPQGEGLSYLFNRDREW